jgi:hypothetical protein
MFHERASDLMVTLQRVFNSAFSIEELQMTLKLGIQEFNVDVVQRVGSYTPGTMKPYHLNVSLHDTGKA